MLAETRFHLISSFTNFSFSFSFHSILCRISLKHKVKMKFLHDTLVTASVLSSCVSAFPSYLSETMLRLREGNHPLVNTAENGDNTAQCPFSAAGKSGGVDDEKAAAAGCPFAAQKQKRQAPGVTPPFDPTLQYVSTSGAHAFVPPSGNDQRGPCKSRVLMRYERERHKE